MTNNKKNDLGVNIEVEPDDGNKSVGKKNVVKKPNSGRRKALLGAAVGASSAAWYKPIVSSVVLPAHAQTSEEPTPPPPPPPPPPAESTPFFGANVSANPIAKSNSLLDLLVPEAVAGVVITPDEYAISVVPIGSDGAAFTISLFEDLGDTQEGFSLAQVVYSGDVSTESGGSLSPTDNPCNLAGLVDIDIEITNVGDDTIDLDLTNRSQSLSVPAGEGNLPVPMCTDAPEPEPDPLSFMIEEFVDDSNLAQRGSILGLLIPDAHAGIRPVSGPTTYTILAQETGSETGRFTVTLLESVENPDSQTYSLVESTFSGELDGPGTGTLGLMSAGCDDAPMGSINAEIDSVSETELVMQLVSRETGPISLTPGTIVIPDPMCEMLPLADNYFQEGGGGQVGMKEPASSLLDLLIPSASAQNAPPENFGVSAIRVGSSNDFEVELLNNRGNVLRGGTINTDGSSGSLAVIGVPTECNQNRTAIPAQIDFIDESVMELRITRTGEFEGDTILISVPAGSGVLTATCEQQPQ